MQDMRPATPSVKLTSPLLLIMRVRRTTDIAARLRCRGALTPSIADPALPQLLVSRALAREAVVIMATLEKFGVMGHYSRADVLTAVPALPMPRQP